MSWNTEDNVAQKFQDGVNLDDQGDGGGQGDYGGEGPHTCCARRSHWLWPFLAFHAR
jgi:hypothetical protein